MNLLFNHPVLFILYLTATGTGKSLSIICGALTWLKHHEEKHKEDLKAEISKFDNVQDESDDDDEEEWISAATKKREKLDKKVELKQELDFLLAKEEKIRELRRRRQTVQQSKVQKVDADFDELFKDAKEVQDAVRKELSAMRSGIDPADNEYMLDDYQSDDEKKEDDSYMDPLEEKCDFSVRV